MECRLRVPGRALRAACPSCHAAPRSAVELMSTLFLQHLPLDKPDYTKKPVLHRSSGEGPLQELHDAGCLRWLQRRARNAVARARPCQVRLHPGIRKTLFRSHSSNWMVERMHEAERDKQPAHIAPSCRLCHPPATDPSHVCATG